jgi:hypothetical protein
MAEALTPPKSLTERLVGTPSWVWFAAAFVSSFLGSETWPWLLAMPFVTHFLVWRENQQAAAAATGAGSSSAAERPPAVAAKGVPSKKIS